ncbi:hydrolase 1, exosortase A system-associated [Novosphingobium ginsenosidimutans]|uniref:Hydrolase 1, exosortase A system-associated n=1 Tax=Novosphingobium ginsenosidimutans TaxID=1176536 RepID=A0A5B8S5T8_9SPHN|nr:hydrolase 1, exosortase A system-associated [Novosphingobium ginsenosidimutans]QEA16901.1 hydrolase 1, exosortase A system-associated [Novosphingobium ginsenosidimutans]
MTRRPVAFACDGSEMVGTLDLAAGRTGLLIVTGGNELRAGPWGSQAQIAEKVATAGFPTFRFDRRGVGDSAGDNAGFARSAADIAAAVAAFRAQVPTLERIVAFGNCDAASALMLAGGAGLDALALANPWTFEPEPGAAPEVAKAPAQQTMPPSVLRRHYLRRLTDPRAIWRLLTGQVELSKMASSLTEAAKSDGAPTPLAKQLADGLARFTGPVTILLAENDRTAQAFLANWDKADPHLHMCPGASHSFIEPQARLWLLGQILAMLRSFN